MKITQEADYALRVVAYLSKMGYGNKITAAKIAEEENIPMRFLLKLLRKLKAAGIIESILGVGGGYTLKKLPEDITLKDVIEAVDGPIYINRCLYDPEKCNLKRASRCNVHNALRKIQQILVTELGSINFKDIVISDTGNQN
ncbi:RrF2 family transcriptional regulator [Thermoanaerobacterium sp. DL9XJH110]|uniref:RrF2 family transcriptional regulator n=1 Tax=Thermoanaerobacterium sp. DL9XJH110 TaxID=3386643 RepID=UPI003BB797AE